MEPHIITRSFPFQHYQVNIVLFVIGSNKISEKVLYLKTFLTEKESTVSPWRFLKIEIFHSQDYLQKTEPEIHYSSINTLYQNHLIWERERVKILVC